MGNLTDGSLVMVVDDDEGLGMLMAEALAVDGHKVEVVRSGSAALEYLGRKRPDLMLLDLKLHDMDGTVLLERLKSKKRGVPYVVVTGKGDEKVAAETMRAGGLDYVMKDTGLLDLLPGIVKRALESISRDKELAESQLEGRRLEREIVSISDLERQNIGADLHDGLGQQLTAIELICTSLKEDASSLHPDFGDRLALMGRMLREAIAQARLLARGLVPIGAGEDALPLALTMLAEQMSASGSVACRVELSDAVRVPDPVVAGQLYRIAQEAVTNAVRHGKASKVGITLGRVGRRTVLRISDNGKGMKANAGQAPGIGLRVMKHRASIVGVDLDITSTRDVGVTVTCTLPDQK